MLRVAPLLSSWLAFLWRILEFSELTYCHSKDDGRPDDPTDLDHLLRDWMHLQSGSTDGDLAGHKFPE
ncbi:uncharacterized protein LOC143027106 isoform X2 [Oratosquilla oratoria]|uniref:uncharacterized protein LOC143027106 isoform X2 n=1 Tax=Oratosquilla oratoria TaxID=337810 RepID=UPI003F775843